MYLDNAHKLKSQILQESVSQEVEFYKQYGMQSICRNAHKYRSCIFLWILIGKFYFAEIKSEASQIHEIATLVIDKKYESKNSSAQQLSLTEALGHSWEKK